MKKISASDFVSIGTDIECQGNSLNTSEILEKVVVSTLALNDDSDEVEP